MNLTTLLIAIAVLALAYLTGLLRPTGLLSRTRPKLTGAAQARMVLIFFLAVIGFGLLWAIGYEGIWHRLSTELEGTITARKDFPQTRQTHGPTTVYTVRRNDGSLGEYTALDHNDASLPRTMPVGAFIVKRRWELSYTLNGQRIDDYSITLYATFMAIGFVFLTGAFVLSVGEQRRDASRAEG